MKNIKWIFFDIGSTLVDESKAYEHRIKDTIQNTDITYKHFCNLMIDFAKQGKNGYTEAANALNLKTTKWHSEDEFLYPDTINTLELLSEKYKIGIIANQPLGTQERLRKMGIDKYISLVISSAEENVSKPDLKIFKLALDRADCSPDNSVMVGDRLDNDIIPAKAVGMKTIWIKQGLGGLTMPKNKNETADLTVESISEICCYLKNSNIQG
ncbi:MAG: HAD family hydrolase [Clostridiales bacterium]|nr:HAD family hydrolase [Clostridiales bacterium]